MSCESVLARLRGLELAGRHPGQHRKIRRHYIHAGSTAAVAPGVLPLRDSCTSMCIVPAADGLAVFARMPPAIAGSGRGVCETGTVDSMDAVVEPTGRYSRRVPVSQTPRLLISGHLIR